MTTQDHDRPHATRRDARDPDRPRLSPRDDAWVQQVESLTRAPEMSAEARVAFTEGLDRRLARGPAVRFAPAWTGALLAAFVVALVWWSRADPGVIPAVPTAVPEIARSPEQATPPEIALAPEPSELASAPATNPTGETAPVEALLSLAEESDASDFGDLPDDYAAIASLILDG